MATELPEAGIVSRCVAIGKAMAPELPEASTVALCYAIAVGCREILKQLLHFLEVSPARGLALEAAVIFVVYNVVMTFVTVVILLYLVTLGVDIPVVLAVIRQFVLFVYALPLAVYFLFVVLALLFFLFHLLPAAGGNTPN